MLFSYSISDAKQLTPNTQSNNTVLQAHLTNADLIFPILQGSDSLVLSTSDPAATIFRLCWFWFIPGKVVLFLMRIEILRRLFQGNPQTTVLSVYSSSYKQTNKILQQVINCLKQLSPMFAVHRQTYLLSAVIFGKLIVKFTQK